MKTKVMLRTILVLSFALNLSAHHALSQGKLIEKVGAPGVPHHGRRFVPPDSSNIEQTFRSDIGSKDKNEHRIFDRTSVDREITMLKKIADERAMIESLHQVLEQQKEQKSVRETHALRKPDRLTLLGEATRFPRAPVATAPAPRKYTDSPLTTLVSNAQINGKTRDTIDVGESFTLTFSLAPAAVSAIVNIHLVVDSSIGNLLLGRGLLMDNDDYDDNPAIGQCKITFPKSDLLSNIISTMVFEVDDYQSVSSAMLTVRQKPQSGIVLGTVLPARADIACRISGDVDPVYVFTDRNGKFSFYVDREQTKRITIRPKDITGGMNGFTPPETKQIDITSDTVRANITYSVATSFVEGYVRDQAQRVVRNAIVSAYGSPFDTMAKTDSTGHYRLGITQGTWYLNVTVPWTTEYLLRSHLTIISAVVNTTLRRDLSVTKANSAISGKVTFNTRGLGGIPMYAETDSSYNFVLSSTGGAYAIPVDGPSSGTRKYTVFASVSPGYFVENSPRANVAPGATNVNFSVKVVPGGLQGRITDSRSGEGIPDALIRVTGTEYRSVLSNDSGYYRVSLPNGTYSVRVERNLYLTQMQSNINISGAKVTRNFVLRRSGTISGTVRDGEGKPMSLVSIVAYDTSGFQSSGYTSTDSRGKYTLGGLSTRTYKVVAQASGTVTQWYDKARTHQNATPVDVTEGLDTPNIDFVLSRGGTISGKVEDSKGNPIPNIRIVIFDTLLYSRSTAVTNDSGKYDAGGLDTGTFLVFAYGSSLYIGQWYAGASTSHLATRVNVVIDQKTSNINFTLYTGASISGTIRNKSNAPLSGSFVSVLDSALRGVSSGHVDVSGTYLITGLKPGMKLYVVASSVGYLPQWYNNATARESATSITLQAEEKREHIDFILILGGSITGSVRDFSGNPVPFASVFVQDTVRTGVGNTYSDATGNYTVRGLPTGKYVVASLRNTYLTQWFDRKDSFEKADRITVLEEVVTPDINFQLQRPAGITGKVVDDSSGLGLSGVRISAIRQSSGVIIRTASSDMNGNFFIELPADYYLVQASDQSWVGYLEQYYSLSGGTPVRAEAQVLTVVAGQPPTTTNFRLQKRKSFYSFAEEKLGMTITNFGQLGYWQDTTLPSGRWPVLSSPNYLYEGDIWVGGDISNTRYVAGGLYEGTNSSWVSRWNYTVQGNLNSKKVATYFADRSLFQGLVVRQQSSSWPTTDFGIHEYTIVYEPGTKPQIRNAYVGFFMDFDISTNGRNDNVGIDKSQQLAYMYNAEALNGVAMGICLLSGPATRMTWWRIGTDPRTDSLQYAKMVADTSNALPAAPADYRVLVSTGPFTLKPGDSINVVVALVAGNGVTGITETARQARARYVATGVEEEAPMLAPIDFILHQNYPNPFNPSTTIAFEIPTTSRVSVKIFNLLGQELATLVNDELTPGRYRTTFEGKGLSSGVYLYVLKAGDRMDVKRMILMK